MKNIIYIILGVVSFASLAQAADKTDGVSSSIAVERIICQPAIMHTPSSDVTYKPGVDVNGNPVASADLNPAPPIMNTTYTEVPLNIDLARKLKLSPEKEMEGTFGNLKIYQDGHILYNGQDITQQAYVVCGKDPATAPALTATATPAPAANVTTMPQNDVALPGTTAPSATTPAK